MKSGERQRPDDTEEAVQRAVAERAIMEMADHPAVAETLPVDGPHSRGEMGMAADQLRGQRSGGPEDAAFVGGLPQPMPVRKPAASQEGSFPHEGLAVACAKRFLGRGVAMEDLLQEARAAVCLAEERFDPARGLRFSTYAAPVVLGALRAYCRNAAPMHVPRQELRLLQQARAVQEEAGRSAGARERSDGNGAAGADPQRLYQALQVDGKRLEEMLAAAERMRRMTADPETAALAREDGFEERVLLRDAVRRLGSPYAGVIGLRYLCGFSQREVGQRLGVAQWQVCRWEKMGLGMLRAEMK